MDKLTLKLEPRTVIGKKVKHLRTQGLVPASICGKGIESKSFVTDARIFNRVYQRAGRSGLIELQTPDGVLQAFIRQVQRHPITTVWLHVDFHVVDMNVRMTADVPVAAIGENALIEKNGGMLNILLPNLHVRALPNDLPQAIEVDVSGITEFNTALHVSDLKLNSNIEILTPADEAILTINPSNTSAQAQQDADEGTEDDPKTINDPDKATE